MRGATEVAFVALAFAGLLTAVATCGCEPPKSTREAAAEGAYGVALQRCVDKYDTEAEMDACADGVRMRWGTLDGGAR